MKLDFLFLNTTQSCRDLHRMGIFGVLCSVYTTITACSLTISAMNVFLSVNDNSLPVRQVFHLILYFFDFLYICQ